MSFQYKVAAVVIAAAVAGCSAAPILNVKEAPVATASGKALSAQEVRSAILRAGSALGWQMRDEGPSTFDVGAYPNLKLGDPIQ